MSRSGPVATEAQVQRGVLRLLRLHGFHCWRQNAGAAVIGDGPSRRYLRAGPKDTADLLGIVPARLGVVGSARLSSNAGRLLACETKRPGARPRPSQLAWLRRINGDGGLAFWADEIAVAQLVLDWLGIGPRIEIDIADDGQQHIHFASEDRRP